MLASGGRMMYGAQAEPLLVMVKVETMLGSVTRHTLCQWRSKGLGDYSSPGDLPAFESYDGYRAWYRNGLRHRAGGKLAIVNPHLGHRWPEGYYLYGVEVKK